MYTISKVALNKKVITSLCYKYKGMFNVILFYTVIQNVIKLKDRVIF